MKASKLTFYFASTYSREGLNYGLGNKKRIRIINFSPNNLT